MALPGFLASMLKVGKPTIGRHYEVCRFYSINETIAARVRVSHAPAANETIYRGRPHYTLKRVNKRRHQLNASPPMIRLINAEVICQ